MRVPALLLALVTLPSLAHARPITAGVGLGLTEAKADAGPNVDANHTLSLFGRIGFSPRVAAQLELQRIETDAQGVDIRTATGLVVIDLGSGGHLMPILLAGLGLDDASTSYGSDTTATHVEAGFGLEYRADGGFTIGADVRIGDRSLDQGQPIAYPVNGVAAYTPSMLQDGEYRSARVTAGIRF